MMYSGGGKRGAGPHFSHVVFWQPRHFPPVVLCASRLTSLSLCSITSPSFLSFPLSHHLATRGGGR